MMGIHQPQKELFSYQVDLDRRVRADHPLRRLNSVLDLSFVRTEVSRCYGVSVPATPSDGLSGRAVSCAGAVEQQLGPVVRFSPSRPGG